MKKTIYKRAFLNAALTAIYVVVIASFLFFIPRYFGPMQEDTFIVPIVMLSLLVFSAALTGSLLFGLPVLWYLDGKKKEAVYLLCYTLAFFLIFTLCAVLVLFLTR